MILKAINDGGVTGSAAVTCPSSLFGVLISTDGTNAGTVTVQRDDGSGKTVFDYVGLGSLMILGPISLEETTALYYTVSGTGASAQFFEYVP